MTKITVSEDGTTMTFETDRGDVDAEEVGEVAKTMYGAVYSFNHPE